MNNKDRFVLYDNNSEFEYKKNKSEINIKFNRVAFIFFVFFLISVIYTIHLIHLGLQTSNDLNKDQIKVLNKLKRADIVDRNGNFLAKTVSSVDIGINPVEIIDHKKLLLNLGYIFPNKNYELIQSKFKKNKFFWFEKKISDENYEKIMMLGDKSIKPEEKLTRVYPQKNLFSHIIGQIDRDIQFLIREELIKYNKIFKTKGSAAILMNVNNGEILTLTSLPDFNPNLRINIKDKNFINRVTKGVYEFGSVFKTFTLAAGIHEKVVEPETKFQNLEKSILCGKNTISEYDKKIPSDLTAEQILIRSGNIGSVRIAQAIGLERFKTFLDKLGLINSIKFDIEEVGTPISFRWGKCKLATTSYGHGITTTILQLAKAYSIIVNGGYNISPTLIKNKFKLKNKKILNNDVSKKINPILRKIVTTKEGTASLANVDGYEIGGKTGTAQTSNVGGYSNKKINTFSSIFPTSNPKYVLIVMLDEPKTNSEYIYHYRDGSGIKYKGTPFNTAGWTSVEVVGQIIEKIGPILATKYNEVY
jgi:cell division protein FtsI (penicillin-binding protein 3)